MESSGAPPAPRPWRRWLVRIAVLALVAVTAGTLTLTRREAFRLVTSRLPERPVPTRTPADLGLPWQGVHAIAADGMKSVGWYLPGSRDALVLVLHGYKAHRGEVLDEAAAIARHGFHVLVTSVRAHDRSDGEVITFGVREVQDLAAWHALARGLPGVDAAKIGLYGSSMGGSIAIQYAAGTPDIRAVVSDSAFSSLDDTIAVSVPHQTGLPAFPFAPLIVFWAERIAGFDSSAVDAKQWIGRLAPRPILILQSADDVFISPDSGQRLFDAAGDPKELWFEAGVTHARFARERPEEFEKRVVGFFEEHLK